MPTVWIDDADESRRLLVTTLLRLEGYDVEPVSGPDDAAALLGAGHMPDLAIVDGAGGASPASWLEPLAHPDRGRLPVIVLPGAPYEQPVFVARLHAPLDFDELFELVDRCGSSRGSLPQHDELPPPA